MPLGYFSHFGIFIICLLFYLAGSVISRGSTASCHSVCTLEAPNCTIEVTTATTTEVPVVAPRCRQLRIQGVICSEVGVRRRRSSLLNSPQSNNLRPLHSRQLEVHTSRIRLNLLTLIDPSLCRASHLEVVRNLEYLCPSLQPCRQVPTHESRSFLPRKLIMLQW